MDTSPPLQVLHVLNSLNRSGAETMLASAAPIFSAAGIKGTILSTGDIPGPFAGTLRAAGYDVIHIPFSKSPAFLWRIWRQMCQGYDIVHLHTERGHLWYGLLARLAGAKIVLRTIHAIFGFTGTLRLRRGLARRLLHRLGVHHIAISPSVRDNEAQRFGLPTTVIPNWYDSTRFVPVTAQTREQARLRLGIEPAAQVIASVGNCATVKNHPAILHALALLPAAQRPRYLHLGQEEPDTPERRLAKTLGVHEYTHFLDPAFAAETVLQAADVFVMPSLHEGMGIALLEAMATGLPAIASDVPGLRDFAGQHPGQSIGVRLVPPAAEPLATALVEVLALAPSERTEYGAANAVCATTHYTIELGTAAYLRLFRRAVTSDRDGPETA
jgi:glycosyltransferase involved in cell wall biosynthesis